MQSLALLCAECACILGKGVAEVAATLSLPEVLLLIRKDQERRMESLRWDTQSRALAASAIWSKPAAQALGRFERSLRIDTATTETKPADLHRLYGGAGVPVQALP